MTLREYLFKGMTGCHNGDCIIRTPTGMTTNSSCHCLENFDRRKLGMLRRRLTHILEMDVSV